MLAKKRVGLSQVLPYMSMSIMFCWHQSTVPEAHNLPWMVWPLFSAASSLYLYQFCCWPPEYSPFLQASMLNLACAQPIIQRSHFWIWCPEGWFFFSRKENLVTSLLFLIMKVTFHYTELNVDCITLMPCPISCQYIFQHRVLNWMVCLQLTC